MKGKKTIRRFIVNERALCESYTWQSTHGKGGDIHPEERNIVQRVCNICDSHK